MWWQFFDWHKIGARILYLLFLWYGPTVPCLQENYKLNYLVLRKFRLCALSCISVSVWMPVGDLWHGVTVWKSLYVYSMNRLFSSIQFTWNCRLGCEWREIIVRRGRSRPKNLSLHLWTGILQTFLSLWHEKKKHDISLWRRAYTQNVRLSFPYRQYTNIFYISICITVIL